jgi:DNA-binding MarR family transcriptional regulator
VERHARHPTADYLDVKIHEVEILDAGILDAVKRDLVDDILAQWQRVRPDVDASPMAVVFRVKRLARTFERATAKNFASLDLEPGEFDLLATLRRAGPPHQMSAGALGRALMITSGSVTNRVDRLEDRDLIRRTDDPDDRRGVLVELTTKGLRAVDGALERHLAIEHELIAALSPAQRTQLADLLRRLLLALGDDVGARSPVT